MTRYATTSDLVALGIVAASVSGVSTPRQEAALDSASAFADGYLGKRFALPLTAWGTELRECVACIAAETVLNVAGHNPAAGRDDITTVRAERWRQWLRDVAKGNVVPDVTDSSPDVPPTNTAVVASRPRRGWN